MVQEWYKAHQARNFCRGKDPVGLKEGRHIILRHLERCILTDSRIPSLIGAHMPLMPLDKLLCFLTEKRHIHSRGTTGRLLQWPATVSYHCISSDRSFSHFCSRYVVGFPMPAEANCKGRTGYHAETLQAAFMVVVAVVFKTFISYSTPVQPRMSVGMTETNMAGSSLKLFFEKVRCSSPHSHSRQTPETEGQQVALSYRAIDMWINPAKEHVAD